MNEKLTITELKYQNKQKLDAAYASFELIKSNTYELKDIVDKLYTVVIRGMALLDPTVLERDMITRGDTITDN